MQYEKEFLALGIGNKIKTDKKKKKKKRKGPKMLTEIINETR